jgi:uncharacterized protein (TIGR00251 family)
VRDENAATIQVRVVPRAPRSRIEGWQAGALKVRLHAPPVDGKANAALVALLAEALAIGKGSVEIISGETARLKLVRIHGLSAEQINMRLGSSF